MMGKALDVIGNGSWAGFGDPPNWKGTIIDIQHTARKALEAVEEMYG